MVTFCYLGYICNLLHDEDFEKNDLKFCFMLTTSPLRMFFVIGSCSFTICCFCKYQIFLPSWAAFQSSFKTWREFKLNLSTHQRILDPIRSHCCFVLVWSICYDHMIQLCNFLQQLEVGWSELAATNAPVADEPVEAVFWMNKKSHTPCPHNFFFHLFSTPKFSPSYLPSTSPLLPTTYQPLPPLTPSPELQRRWAGASLEQELGGELRAAERLKPARGPRGSKSGTQVST